VPEWPVHEEAVAPQPQAPERIQNRDACRRESTYKHPLHARQMACPTPALPGPLGAPPLPADTYSQHDNSLCLQIDIHALSQVETCGWDTKAVHSCRECKWDSTPAILCAITSPSTNPTKLVIAFVRTGLVLSAYDRDEDS
jgi:hypothetical protein